MFLSFQETIKAFEKFSNLPPFLDYEINKKTMGFHEALK
jgi:hypothetical protein